MFIKHEDAKPINFDNLKIIDFTAGHDTSSSFAEITVPVGIHHKFSWSNRSDKYYYVVEGNIIFTIKDESRNLLSGDVCIVRKDIRFKYQNPGPNDAKLILIHTPDFRLEFEVFEK